MNRLASLVLLTLLACSGDPAPSSAPADDGGPADEALAPLAPFVAHEPPAYELPADESPLRRAYSHIRVDVDGDIARTVVTEVLVNDLDSAAEAVFRFPLPDDAAVTDFAEWKDGSRVRAALIDEDDARRAFDRAAAAGERAALAEESGRHFDMTLAAIPPGGQRRVELSFVQTLEALGGEQSYVLPARRFDGAPPTVLDLEVEIAATREITAIEVPSHPDARVTRRSESRRSVHLSRPRRGLERDVVVRWQQPTEDLDIDGRAVRRGEGEPAFVEARFAFHRDPRPDERPPIAAVLVIDRSLSMAGEPLARAQELAAEIVAALGPKDSLAVVSFAGDVRTLGLAPATDAHRAAAESELADLVARGHSNLPAALDEAAAMLAGRDDGLLVLLSDGQPTVGDDLEELLPASRAADFAGVRTVVAQFNYPSRTAAVEQVFPDAAVHFVPDGDAGGDAVTKLARLAVAPVLEDLRVELVGAEEGTVHGALPTRLAEGESVRLLARADADLTLRVSATLRGRPVTLERRIAMPTAPDARGDRGLPVEWARARLRDLDRRYAAGERDLEAEIRAVGTDYRLATRFTSFVSTDSLSPDRIKPGDPEIRVRAPRSAIAVYGVLPSGEIVPCTWSDAHAAWIGRFLVPRGTPDGVYRLRVFVDEQSGPALRSTLFYRVDSEPPRFELDARYAGGVLSLRARPAAAVFDTAPGGDEIQPDRVDLRRVIVRVGDRDLELTRDGDEWTAELTLPLAPGVHDLVLVATDYAANASETRARLEVTR